MDALLALVCERSEEADVLEHNQHGNLSLKIKFRAIVVNCYVSYAEAPANSVSAVAWKQAIDTCIGVDCNAMPLTDAVEMVERAVQVAQMADDAGGDEIS